MVIMQSAGEPGLTLDSVVRNLPHDAGAVVVYLLLIAFVGFIWYGSRKPAPRDGQREDG